MPLLFARGSPLTLGPPCRELAKEPHLATSPRDEELVQLLLRRWQDPESGLDSAGTSEYEVLLSFPSQKQPNRVDVGEVLLWPGEACGPGELPAQPGHCPLSTVGPAGDILFSSQRSEEKLTGEQGDPNVVPPYAAYAPPGTPQVGLGHPLPLPWPSSRWLLPSCSHPDPRAAEEKCLNWGSAPPRIYLLPHSTTTPFAHHLVIQQTLMGPAQSQA